eukprot:6199155-Pleurochrysis_carterae.AAC.1
MVSEGEREGDGEGEEAGVGEGEGEGERDRAREQERVNQWSACVCTSFACGLARPMKPSSSSPPSTASTSRPPERITGDRMKKSRIGSSASGCCRAAGRQETRLVMRANQA